MNEREKLERQDRWMHFRAEIMRKRKGIKDAAEAEGRPIYLEPDPPFLAPEWFEKIPDGPREAPPFELSPRELRGLYGIPERTPASQTITLPDNLDWLGRPIRPKPERTVEEFFAREAESARWSEKFDAILRRKEADDG